MKTGYDTRTAVTFLMIGLGVGALLTSFFYLGRDKKFPVQRDISKETDLNRMSA